MTRSRPYSVCSSSHETFVHWVEEMILMDCLVIAMRMQFYAIEIAR